MNLRRVQNLPLNDLNDGIEPVKDLRGRDTQSRPENFFPPSSESYIHLHPLICLRG